MASVILVDTTSTQTLTNKTLTSPAITGASCTLAAAPTTSLEAATKGYVDGLNTNPIINGSLAASVSTNILTVSLKTAGGSTPSSSDPVRVTFRNGTDTDGSLVTRTVTSAVTMTISSGSTLGTANATAARLWVGLIDNAGTVELCIWNPLAGAGTSDLSLKGYQPNLDVTTTAEGSGTATSAHTLYSTNARSTVPFTLLGFLEITEATAGVWATAPASVQTYQPGMAKTGDIIQTIFKRDGALATGTTTIPFDDTIPQNTEGDQYMTLAITPLHSSNLLDVYVQAVVICTQGGNAAIALFQDSTANALAANWNPQAIAANGDTPQTLRYRMAAGTTVSTTFKVRAGSSAAGTTNFNGSGGARKYGGVLDSVMEIKEIYV